VSSAPGSLGEEAARLAAAVQDWLQTPHEEAEPGGESPPECMVCPACRLLRLVQGTRPEVYGHLADAAASLSAALREMTGDRTPGAARRGNVEHIDLG
jgi:hypothetical protein